MLADGNGYPMNEIASKIQRKKNTVTVLIEKLIQLEFVQKKASSTDKRVMLISLTPQGKKFMPDFYTISEALINRAYFGFNDEEKILLNHMLTRIHNNFNRSESELGLSDDVLLK